MLTKITRESDLQFKTIKGHTVIEEAAQLLRKIHFVASLLKPVRDENDKNALLEMNYQKGEHLSVTVDPQRDEGTTKFSAIITCFVFGHRQVDWEGMPIFAIPTGNPTTRYTTFLDQRGRAVISGLDAGKEYRIEASTLWGRSEGPICRTAEGPWSERIFPFIGEPEITLTVGRPMEGKLIVGAETFSPPLDGSRVFFSFIPSDMVSPAPDSWEEFQLIKEQKSKVWVGRWSEERRELALERRELALAAAGETEKVFFFCLMPS